MGFVLLLKAIASIALVLVGVLLLLYGTVGLAIKKISSAIILACLLWANTFLEVQEFICSFAYTFYERCL